MNIIVTGFSGCGSSAVIDLLKECKNCAEPFERAYEHILFYTPDGMFDLEYKLLFNNDVHRSDEAIHEFYNSMEKLYKYDFGWFGGYKNNIGSAFMEAVTEFIDDISDKYDGMWFYDYERTRFSLVKMLLQLVKKYIFKRRINKLGLAYVIKKQDYYFSMPSKEEFYREASSFVQKYFKVLEKDKYTIYDHLIWPQHIDKIDNYFSKSEKFIVLDRDPRDLFFLNKYYWRTKKLNASIPVPLDVKVFVEFWKKVHQKEISNTEQVLKIQFEDLVYNYESTVENIMKFTGVNHIEKGKYFDPSKSINNTQVFNNREEFKEELIYIERNLQEYLYEFPEKVKTDERKIFD